MSILFLAFPPDFIEVTRYFVDDGRNRPPGCKDATVTHHWFVISKTERD